MKWMIFVLMAALLCSGCGKDIKVGIRAAEAEKDKPSATLVRKLEVSYHDPRGQEQMRESMPVLGLSQPMSMRADLLKGIAVEKDGIFEAHGYSAEGQLLLRGRSQVDPETSDLVEIILDREAVRVSELGSPMLRRIRLADAPLSSEFVRDTGQLRHEMDAQRCLELPSLRISSSAGSYPKVVFEGLIKSPSFALDIEGASAREGYKSFVSKYSLPINSAGDAELELGKRLFNGLLLKKSVRLRLKIYSDRYEGCLEVQTNPTYLPVTAFSRLDAGVGTDFNPYKPKPLGVIEVFNPNEMPVQIKVVGIAVTRALGGQRVAGCFHRSEDDMKSNQINCVETFIDVAVVGAKEAVGVSFYGAMDPPMSGIIKNRGFQVNWSVLAIFDDGNVALPTPVAPTLIP